MSISIDDLHEARDRLVTRASHGIEMRNAPSGLLQLGHGAYMEPDEGWRPWELQRMTALCRLVWITQTNPESVVLLESAALLHGLPLTEGSERLHLVATPGRNGRSRILSGPPSTRRNSPIVVRHRWDIPESDVVEIHGIRTVSLERLMLDIARFRPAREAFVIADAALRELSGASRWDRAASSARAVQILEGVKDRLMELSGARGVRRAREVLALTNPFAESAGESQARWMLLANGLAVPTTQKHVAIHGRDYFIDIWVEDIGRGFEYDGLGKYDTSAPEGRRALVEEKDRAEALRAAGYPTHSLLSRDVASVQAGRLALLRIMGPHALANLTPRPLLSLGY